MIDPTLLEGKSEIRFTRRIIKINTAKFSFRLLLMDQNMAVMLFLVTILSAMISGSALRRRALLDMQTKWMPNEARLTPEAKLQEELNAQRKQ